MGMTERQPPALRVSFFSAKWQSAGQVVRPERWVRPVLIQERRCDVTPIHRSCHWQYFYGDEYEACRACRQQLLDAEELFCFGAFTKDAKYPSPTLSCCNWCSCCFHCHCPFDCRCLSELWNEVFRRARGDGDRVRRLLPEDVTPLEFGCVYHEGYAIAYRITGNDADAHDAVQTAFFKIHRQPESPQHLRALFHCAVKRAALDIVRNRKRHVSIEEERLPSHIDGDQGSFTDDMLPFLPKAIGKLPSADQRILRLHYFDGLTHQEIADRMKIPRSTVNMRLLAARRRLEAELRKHGERELVRTTSPRRCASWNKPPGSSSS